MILGQAVCNHTTHLAGFWCCDVTFVRVYYPGRNEWPPTLPGLRELSQLLGRAVTYRIILAFPAWVDTNRRPSRKDWHGKSLHPQRALPQHVLGAWECLPNPVHEHECNSLVSSELYNLRQAVVKVIPQMETNCDNIYQTQVLNHDAKSCDFWFSIYIIGIWVVVFL